MNKIEIILTIFILMLIWGACCSYTFYHIGKIAGAHEVYEEQKKRINKKVPPYILHEILFNCRDDADAIIRQLIYILNNFGSVRVADLHDLIGRTNKFKDYNYGWTDLSQVKVIKVNGRYNLDFPPVIKL